ncbi:MAG TPA: hypothetical protein VJ875_17860 [Pyrinomonadaceae bacterium]|nr:hypothetical protein [Pyrinomonadaceae bacterium]
MRKILLLVPLLWGLSIAAEGPIDRWAKAVGGREKVAAINTIYREASIEYAGYEGSLKVWHTSDGKYRKEEQIATYSLIETFDGHDGFVKQGDQPPHKITSAELTLASSKRFSNSNAMLFAFFPQRHPGTITIESDDVIVLKPEGGVDWRVTLDSQTSLPKTMVHKEGEQTIRTKLSTALSSLFSL